MLLTDDLKGARRRLTAWWNGEVEDRVAWAITARRAEPREAVAPPPEARDIEDWWTNPQLRLARWEQALAQTEYLGEAIPYFDTQIGPGSLGVMLGARPHFAPETVWYEPCLNDLDRAPDLRFDPANEWFQRHLALIRYGLEHAQGRYLVSTPDLIEGLDTLAALHNNQRLLFDLVDRPRTVHRFLRRITDLYFAAYDPIYDLTKDETGGSCFSAFATWAPGRHAKLQCDFSAMIGPAMFREFVAPYLAAQCERLDYAMYHLDGPDCIRHLDALLDVPRLQVIQWTPGAGAPGVADPCWFDMYRHILRRKGVILIGVPLDQAEQVVRAIGARGVFMVSSAASVEEAREALEAAKGWS